MLAIVQTQDKSLYIEELVPTDINQLKAIITGLFGPSKTVLTVQAMKGLWQVQAELRGSLAFAGISGDSRK